MAGGQYGVVSNGQLRRMGFDRAAVRRRVGSGYLLRLHHGVYAVGHRALPPNARYAAAVLACGPAAALSHRSAADLWDLRSYSGIPTVTVPHGRRALPRSVRVHRSRVLAPQDVTERAGMRVTSVARTLLDLAAAATPRELARLVDRAERLRLFDLGAVEEALSRARGRRGARALRRAIAGWRPRDTRSELEDRFADLVEYAGLPPPQLNVAASGERFTYEVDALWPARRLIVQLDGFAYHRTRRDRERDADADGDLELAGYRVVRLTWGDVTRRRARTARRLERLLLDP